jgi:hypothetical protein
MYTYKKGKLITTLDYFILNDALYNRASQKRLKRIESKDFKNISDHFPILLELDL